MRVTLPLVITTLLGPSLAADCFRDAGQDILSSDIEIAIDDVDSGNLNNAVFPLELKASHFHFVNRGGAKICIENNFLFDNTHVSQADIVAAARNIRDECGRFGGTSQIHSDSGLAVDVVICPRDSSHCT
ncbi:hypothetical protein NW762_011954 [Fusarium torreyae]|uniref:Uncharacterized protein n=1 Tax=Fusarium torreyae TaxID=1237075 RepID=A0A9W8RQU8_9HYPO|nr:hypothetical protein NW762_011954 [Fusarium torreyae]